MITLGIETSCDETSAAVVQNGKVLSNVVYSSLKEHRRYGGVVPEIASRSHLESLLPCLDEALRWARVGAIHESPLRSVDLIAVTNGPGLVGSLLVGVSAAKALSMVLEVPLVGVDHVLAHLYAGLMDSTVGATRRVAPTNAFPVLGLVVSGGHTVLLRMDSPLQVRLLGTTIDDAAGEAFDKVAKMLGLGYPGGPVIDRLGRGADPSLFRFTRPLLSSDSLDFSFSGLKTAVLYEVEALRKRRKWSTSVRRSVAAGFQEAVVDVLIEKTRRAVRREKISTVIVGGGVAANTRLRERLAREIRAEGARAVFPSLALCQDNAAMIAAYGQARYQAGDRGDQGVSVYASWKSNPKNTALISKKNT